MKRLKILPKIFLYTFSIMVFIIIAAHLILYLLAPRIAIDYTPSVISNQSEYVLDGSIDPLQFVSQAIWQALPFSVVLFFVQYVPIFFQKVLQHQFGKFQV